MRRSEMSRWLTAGAVVGCLVLMPGLAGAESANDFVAFRAAGTSAMWIAQPGVGESILSVKGEDVQIRQQVRAGASPVVSLARPDGSTLPDGTYLWELSEAFAGINDAVWDPANGRNTEAHNEARQRTEINGRVQRGAFTVKDGLLVDNSLKEADAR